MLFAGRMGADYLQDRRNQTLQEGIESAMGSAPTVFDADLFPGEQPIEGLYNEGTGLRADPSNLDNQLDFGADIFGLPGGQDFASDIMNNALGSYQERHLQGADIDAAYERQARDLDQDDLHHMEDMQFRDAWNQINLAQDQSEFAQTRLDDQNTPATNYEFSYDDAGNRIEVPKQFSDTWIQYSNAQAGLEDSITTLDDLMTTFQEHGPESFSTAAKGKLGALSAIMQLRAKDILDTGALSQDELEIIGELFADPSNLSGRTNEEQMARYQEGMKLLQRGLAANNGLTKYWNGIGSSEMANQTPSQKRYLEELSRAQREADEQGWTDAPPGAEQRVNPRYGGGPAAIRPMDRRPQ